MDRQICPSYAKIRITRREIKGFGTIAPEILSEICEDPTYASPTYARFTEDSNFSAKLDPTYPELSYLLFSQ